MATVVLQYAGAALGTMLGGPLGGTLGRALGGLAGAAVDRAVFSPTSNREGPRIDTLQVMASQEGAAVPVVYGRMRVAGQVIWATNLIEEASTNPLGGGKGMASASTTTDYAFYANFAVGLCEGEILGIGRAWADGKEIDLADHAPRLYQGSETQAPDSLISAVEGEGLAPAYRGLAYVVFERLPLAPFGNRLPQLAFEVIAAGNDVAPLVEAVTLIPGATEYGYDTDLVTRSSTAGQTTSENTHVSASRSDWTVSLDQLQEACPNVGMASLVVAWFGTDLRCGSCRLMPGVEDTAKPASAVWQVSGTARGDAHVVSRNAGAPAYGGTPSDASVIHAIQDLKARGLKVMFNPFILMDVAADNSLPDPYGGAAQAAYPWRGRLTAQLAPGQNGSSDMTAACAAEISAFLGNATAAQFAASESGVNFSGSEWSYRRMILHYARLCALAGGVDAFLIGSELRGLTSLRSAQGTYPFVTGLVALAAEVKAILPQAQLSYAADWSEYFGHQPQDGSQDVFFNLDPLWASPDISFIGIDAYFPLSDWRDGIAHRDAQDGVRSGHDGDYLASRIAGGECYDWYYATAADREAQRRSPIQDGAAGKPWVFRPKDLKGWWQNAHYNRPGGVEQKTPTAWVPQSKPIWFTEIGCPAIDKGANQPNVFIDAKSAESGLPYFSGGQQDTQMQLSFIRAVSGYWSNPGAQNPASTGYGGTMVDATRIFHWCWDARPFPAFPARSDVWSDAANYARGHWLNGRIGSVELRSLIARLAARFGLADIDVSAVDGTCDGYVIDRPLSARGALEGLLAAFAIDAVESQGLLKFASRRGRAVIPLDKDDLVEAEKPGPLLSLHRAQETDLPVAVSLSYAESGLDYQQATVSQQRSGTSSQSLQTFSIAAALPQHQAQACADVLLAEAWAGRSRASFTLPPSWAAVEPGDVLALEDGLWRITALHEGAARRLEAEAHDPFVYDPPPAPERGVAFASPAVYGAPEVLALDVALPGDDAAPGPRLAAQATPWPGALALYRRSGPSLVFERLLSQPARMGTTLTPLAAGILARVDFAQSLDVELHQGSLAAISRAELLNGGNLAAIGSAAEGYELIQFQEAMLIAPATYRLSGLLRAQAGSAPEMPARRAAGASFIVMDSAVIQPSLSLGAAGQGVTWHVGPAPRDAGHPAYVDVDTPTALKPLRPLAPTYLRLKAEASGLRLSWIRCTRRDGDSWELPEVPLGEASESYRLDILRGGQVLRSLVLDAPTWLYQTADIIADFGAPQTSLDLRLCQMSASLGAGTLLERTVHV